VTFIETTVAKPRSRVLAGACDEPLGVVEGGDLGSEGGHSTGEAPCAAGDVEHRLTRSQPEQPLLGRLHEQVLGGIATTDGGIPPVGQSIPDRRRRRGMFGKVN
jgi:hypothetical protein